LLSQFGFSQTGEYMLDKVIKPRLEEIGVEICDPFFECGMVLDLDHANSMDKYDDRMTYFKEFSAKVPLINNEFDGRVRLYDGDT